MSWKAYDLDKIAHDLVLKYRDKDVLNESHKMRMSVSYGLERFWGEHLRLRNEAAGSYWKDVWNALVDDILKPAQITIPNEPVNIQDPPRGARSEEKKRLEEENTRKIRSMADGLWRFSEEHPDDQRVALAVLTQLCDCLVWWTQRYKSK
jgi:hypothetical protein